MSRASYLLHEGIIRACGLLLSSYSAWLKSQRTPENHPPEANGNGNGNGHRRPNGGASHGSEGKHP